MRDWQKAEVTLTALNKMVKAYRTMRNQIGELTGNLLNGMNYFICNTTIMDYTKHNRKVPKTVLDLSAV